MMMIESLEHRRLFSVSVTEGYSGFYELNGSEGDDVIDVTVSMTDNTFTLDGTTYTDVQYILVNGFGGNDEISLFSPDNTGMIGAAIDAGSGNDTIFLNFDGGVWAGSGDDTLYLSNSYRGEAHGGAGDDQIYISGDCVDAVILGEEGNDLIDCSNNYYAVYVRGGAGNDTLIGSAYDDQLYGDEGIDYIYGLGGSDELHTGGDNDEFADGGDGYDVLYAGGGNVTAYSIQEIY